MKYLYDKLKRALNPEKSREVIQMDITLKIIAENNGMKAVSQVRASVE